MKINHPRTYLSSYLSTKGLNYPEHYTINTTPHTIFYIFFPSGYLIFGNKTLDILFLTDEKGFKYAVSLLSYYFPYYSPNLPENYCYNPLHLKIYNSFLLDGRESYVLTDSILNNFQRTGKMFLKQNNTTKQDPRLTFIGFEEDKIVQHMLECQKPINFIKIFPQL